MIGFGNSISTVDGLDGQRAVPEGDDQRLQHRDALSAILSSSWQCRLRHQHVADLKGKSITTQQRGNTGELITRQLLEVNGINYSDVKVSFVGYTDSVNQMKDGHAVAFGSARRSRPARSWIWPPRATSS